jgi:arsenate reductase-like glutaredoxin family protein
MAEGSSRAILYTAPNCGVSDWARADLTAEGVDFEERDVMKEKAWFDEALKHSIFVPILIRDGKVEVGWKGRVG